MSAGRVEQCQSNRKLNYMHRHRVFRIRRVGNSGADRPVSVVSPIPEAHANYATAAGPSYSYMQKQSHLIRRNGQNARTFSAVLVNNNPEYLLLC